MWLLGRSDGTVRAAPSPGASRQGKINSIHLKLGGWPGPLKKVHRDYMGMIYGMIYGIIFGDDIGIIFISKLVGGWRTPLKNISQMGLLFPTEWNNNPNVPNHQHLNTKIQTPKSPAINGCYFYHPQMVNLIWGFPTFTTALRLWVNLRLILAHLEMATRET